MLGAVCAAALALLGIDSRHAIGNATWLAVLALVAVVAGGLALSRRSPLYGGAVVLVCGAVLVPVVQAGVEGDRRLAMAMVSAPFVVSGALMMVAVALVSERH